MFRVHRNLELSRWSPFKTCKIMMKDKKGGRPKLSPAEKLKYRIAVNLCTKDYFALKAKAAQSKITCTEVARKAIIGCQIQQRLTPEQMDCIRKLSGMGNNLNQIARKANAEGYINARSEYFDLANKIDNVINQMEDGSENC
jgi:hypothetical protein